MALSSRKLLIHAWIAQYWAPAKLTFIGWLKRLGGVGLLLLVLAWPQISSAQVKACGGNNNWPPMSYQLVGQSIQGISVDLLRLILPQVQFELRPWQRCLHEVASASGFDIVMSAAKNPEREKLYLFSKPYHVLTPSYLYLNERFTTPPLQSLADLEKFKVCALHGANISYTALKPGQIETGASNYLSLMRKLERGHCDLVVEMREVLYGFAQIEVLAFQDVRFQIQNLPETKAYPLHFAISRHREDAQGLLDRLNRGIDEQQKSGRLNKLIKHYQAGQ